MTGRLIMRLARRRCLLILLLLPSLATMSRGTVTCPPACTCGAEEVRCQNRRNMTDIPDPLPANDTLRTLLVARVNITVINAPAFQNLRHLTTLDLSNNPIETLGDGAFQDLSQLQTLVLRRNYLKQLSAQTFAGLEGLKRLEMSWNCFVELDHNWFQHLTGLEVLDLARNSIEHVQDKAFVGLSSLKVLNMTRNRLITMSGLSPLISLQNLVVDDNSIRLIENETFSSLVALTRLSLTGNRDLRLLQADAFVSNSTALPLEELSLKGTHLSEVPVGALKTLPALKTLDMSQTAISVVKKASFSAQANLLNLTLDSLPSLSTIEFDAFLGLKRLETLVIANNHMLTNISWGVFRNLSNLKYLDLHNNGMETIRSGLANWHDIKVVDLRGNPIRCDCHASWILSLLNERNNSSSSSTAGKFSVPVKRNITCTNTTTSHDPPEISTVGFTRQITCHMPPRLHQKCLASLTVSDFRCPIGPAPRSKPDNTDQRFKVGIISASLTCLFLLSCGLFLKFHRRVCSVCRRQYRYKAHRNRGMNGGSPTADIVELETTQLEDFDSDLDTSMRP